MMGMTLKEMHIKKKITILKISDINGSGHKSRPNLKSGLPCSYFEQ